MKAHSKESVIIELEKAAQKIEMKMEALENEAHIQIINIQQKIEQIEKEEY